MWCPKPTVYTLPSGDQVACYDSRNLEWCIKKAGYTVPGREEKIFFYKGGPKSATLEELKRNYID